jgi:hypothetical protein
MCFCIDKLIQGFFITLYEIPRYKLLITACIQTKPDTILCNITYTITIA